ncbi:hypothetical protein BJV77DRAFT_779651 [Russula vinacea]|jgi:hypothetical protein|nr:hypothetical protein BJV77DRAFT_779651 [Russula vinacea]
MIASYLLLASPRHPKHEAGRTEAQGRNHPFRSPNTRQEMPTFSSSCPLPCVLFPYNLSIQATHSLTPKRISPSPFICVEAFQTHPCFHCNVSYYYPSLVSSSLFSLPSDNDPDPIGQTMGSLLSLYGWCAVFTPKIHYCLPCFSCQASCDQG